MKKFVLIFLAILLSIQCFAEINIASSKKEISKLKKSIVKMSSDESKLQEKFYKHKLAEQQAKLLMLNTTFFIYRYKKGKRSYQDISKMVSTAYECSYIFPDLGYDNVDAFVRILAWSEWESGFKKDAICVWKKGQVIERKGIKNTIKINSTDYGAWQVNSQHSEYVKKINKLYNKGMFTFKVKRIKSMYDLLDIPTNCVTRCVIETDRKALDWSWKHDHDKEFITKLSTEIYRLRMQGLYDKELVSKYYHLVPVKTYTTKR